MKRWFSNQRSQKRLIASRGIAATVDPPEAEWSMILSPLRTELQRRLALPDGITGFGVVWLRTCYDDDEAYAQLFARLNTDVALESFSNVLDDGELYDFGEDWSRIFNFIPERLLGITTEYEDGLEAAQNRLGLICDAQKEYISGNWDWAMMEEIEQGHLSSGNYQLTGEEKRSNFYKQTTVEIHRWATVSYILIADKKALETGEVLLVYFDDCGRTVRWKRMDPQDGEPLAGAYFDGLHVEMPWFLEAHIGRDYLPGGICGPPFELQEE